MVTYAQEGVQKDNADKRYLPRWTTNVHALWKRADDRQVQDGIIRNLGCGGACLSVDTVLALKETVHLTIRLSWESSVRVNGIVSWVGEKDNQKLTGIRFLNINGTVQETILQHMLEAENIGLADFWFKGWK